MVAWSGGRGKAKRPSGILAGRAGLTRVRGPGWGSPGIHGFGHTHGVQTMSMSSRVAGVQFGVALVAAGCDRSSTTGPKPADDTYAKKLVGVWEGTEEGPKGDKPETGTVEFKADHGLKIAMGPVRTGRHLEDYQGGREDGDRRNGSHACGHAGVKGQAEGRQEVVQHRLRGRQ